MEVVFQGRASFQKIQNERGLNQYYVFIAVFEVLSRRYVNFLQKSFTITITMARNIVLQILHYSDREVRQVLKNTKKMKSVKKFDL